MKVLLAAGIFYPDVGGPAIHVRKIAEALSMNGYDVTVIAYGDDKTNKEFPFKVVRVSRKNHKILQWLIYQYLALRYGWSSKIIYAFDPTAAGIPARIAAFIFNKPFIIRIGGDPIWERVVEMNQRFITIVDYYKNGFYKIDKPVLYWLIKKLISSSDRIVVYGQFFKDFYINYFNANPDKISIIKNPVQQTEKANENIPDNPTVLFAGRFVSYKNLPFVIKVISKVRNKIKKGNLVLIGSGPEKNSLLKLVDELNAKDYVTFKDSLPQEELFKNIRNSTVCIGPALSEFNPNFILESLSLGKPVLLTKGNGLSVELPEEMLFDPFNEEELEVKILNMFDKENYKKIIEKVNSLPLNQGWDNVVNSHLVIIKSFK
jgi:glycosyltransferase involved in cell wall biosynthesis